MSPQEIIEATENFKREALLLAGLTHPNLPSIYDHFSEAGRWYLVMDFIEGETLEERLNKEPEGRLSVEEAQRIGIQLCTVLGYLHGRQPPIIFRDLKPANIMMTPDGHLYLIDFGIARHFKPGQAKDTIAFGSPGYAAPEQYGKAQTTARSDIYSLGANLHQLLTGIDLHKLHFNLLLFNNKAVPHLQLKHVLLAQFSIRSCLRKQAAFTSIQSDTKRHSLPLSRLFNSTQMMLLSIMARDSRLATLIDMWKPLPPMSKPFALIPISQLPITALQGLERLKEAQQAFKMARQRGYRS